MNHNTGCACFVNHDILGHLVELFRVLVRHCGPCQPVVTFSLSVLTRLNHRQVKRIYVTTIQLLLLLNLGPSRLDCLALLRCFYAAFFINNILWHLWL